MTIGYWLYQKNILARRNRPVQARLLDPSPVALRTEYADRGFRDPMQPEPYPVDLRFTYLVNPRDPYPDNYFESSGFNLYSERLVALLGSFGARAESFPVRLVDKGGNELSEWRYRVYHSLEGVIDALDRDGSGWTGEPGGGVARLALAWGSFEPRPLFTCRGVYVNLMRDDVRQAIRDSGLTGFRWLDPALFRSGKYGLPPPFEE